MTAKILDGKALAVRIRQEVTERAQRLTQSLGRPPTLAAVLVGADPANVAYARSKGRWAERCSMGFRLEALEADAGTEAVLRMIRSLNADPGIDGILVEMPLPDGYDRLTIQASVAPAKDVEGVTSENLGRLLAGAPGPRPATAEAIMALLHESGMATRGKRAVVVGRSTVVGKPAALLLLAANATVTIAHTKTVDMAAVTRDAEILVLGAGSPGLITAEHVTPGVTVIDAGTTMVGEGDAAKLTGDADFDALVEVAGAITPVPGGVGPVTTAVLLRNVVDAAEAAARSAAA